MQTILRDKLCQMSCSSIPPPSITTELIQMTDSVVTACYQMDSRCFLAVAAGGAANEAADEYAIKIHSRDHIWMLRIPWHSANTLALLRRRLKVCRWWRRWHFGMTRHRSIKGRVTVGKTHKRICSGITRGTGNVGSMPLLAVTVLARLCNGILQ